MQEKKRTFWQTVNREFRENKSTFLVYTGLRLLVLGIMILQLFNHNYENVFLCILTLTLMIMPSVVQATFRVEFPSLLEIIAFCFSMTIGVLWEFFEFGMDMLFGYDTQKDTVISSISSTLLDPELSNTCIKITNIQDVTINGMDLGMGGYLDIGLKKRMVMRKQAKAN